MKLLEIKRKIGKWQLVFDCFRDYRVTGRHYRFLVGFIKLTSFVKRGDTFNKNYYKGFFKDFTI